MNEFYSEIEEPIRELVKVLRDNGINTTSSCGHEMYIQADLLLSGWLEILHRILCDYYVERGIEPSYEIVARVEVKKGLLWRHWVEIRIGKLGV